MDLLTAQQIVGDHSIPDEEPRKMEARKVLLAEAQRLEAALAALDSDGDEDEHEDSGSGGSGEQGRAQSHAATTTADSVSTEASQPGSAPMTLEEARLTMSCGFSDDHPQKVAARKVLLAEAARLEAQMAALDNDDEDDNEGAAASSSSKLTVSDSAAYATSTSTATAASSISGSPPSAAAFSAAASSSSSAPAMSLQRAHEVMASGLPDTHPDKAEARRVLIEEAARIQASLAAASGSAAAVSRPTAAEVAIVDSLSTGQVPASLAGKLDKLNEIVAEASKAGDPDAEAAERQAQQLARASIDPSKIKDIGQQREGEHDPSYVHRAAPRVSRNFATEEERIHAEANLDETKARVSEIKFDFSFGASSTSSASSSPNKSSGSPQKTEQSSSGASEQFSYQPAWGSSSTSSTSAAATSAPTPSAQDAPKVNTDGLDDWTARKMQQLATMVDTPQKEYKAPEQPKNWILEAKKQALAKKGGSDTSVGSSTQEPARQQVESKPTSSSSEFTFKSFSTAPAQESPAASAAPTQQQQQQQQPTQPVGSASKPKNDSPANAFGANAAVNRSWIEQMRAKALADKGQAPPPSSGSVTATAASSGTSSASTSPTKKGNEPFFKSLAPVDSGEATQEQTEARLSQMQFNFSFK